MGGEQSGTHSARVDDEMQHEAQSVVQGHGSGHVDEGLQRVGLADDTDDPEVVSAEGVTGELRDAPSLTDDRDDPSLTGDSDEVDTA